jgi:hypothetical protein
MPVLKFMEGVLFAFPTESLIIKKEKQDSKGYPLKAKVSHLLVWIVEKSSDKNESGSKSYQ